MNNDEINTLIAAARDDLAAADAKLAQAQGGLGPTPPPSETLEWGLSTGYEIINRAGADQDFELDECRQAGTQLIRLDCHAGIETKIDALVQKILVRDMKPMLCLWGTNKSPNTNPGTFARDTATRYKDVCRHYEICNEPDLNGWQAATYAPFACTAGEQIKGVSADNLVYYGAIFKGTGSGNRPTDFAKALVANDPDPIDCFAMHLYDQPDEWQNPDNTWHWACRGWPSGNRAEGDTVRDILDAAGLQRISVVSSECGSNSGAEADQAKNTADLMGQVGKTVSQVFYYRMIRDGAWLEGALLNTNRSRRQAWLKYQEIATAIVVTTS